MPLPTWAEKLIALYQSHSANQFLLYGNVNDRFLLRAGESTTLGSLSEFLGRAASRLLPCRLVEVQPWAGASRSRTRAQELPGSSREPRCDHRSSPCPEGPNTGPDMDDDAIGRTARLRTTSRRSCVDAPTSRVRSRRVARRAPAGDRRAEYGRARAAAVGS